MRTTQNDRRSHDQGSGVLGIAPCHRRISAALSVICSFLFFFICVTGVSAAETNAVEKAKAPPGLTPEEMFEGGPIAYTNWVEFSTGGFITSGNKGFFQQRLQRPSGAFGGIEDLHYQAEVATNTTLTIDGRGIFDADDYKLKLGLTREKVGYLKFSYDQFRNWSGGYGGFEPGPGLFYSQGDHALDRSKLSFEAGYTPENAPNVIFKYSHNARDGDKNSTIWGIAHPNGVSRGLSPSFYDIDEKSDTFQIDVTHTIDKTDFGLGLRFDTGKLNDALKITQSPNELTERKITDRQGSSFDGVNFHAFTETWLTNNLMFSTAFSFSDFDTDISASRIYGSDFDVGYVPNALNGFGYTGLTGTSRLRDYVSDLNFFYQPIPSLAIVPSVQVQEEDINVNATGSETLGNNAAPSSFGAASKRSALDVRERLDIRYTGVTNVVLFARADLTEGDGNLTEGGGTVPIGGIGIASINRLTEDERLFQKYSAGARWYPSRIVTVDAGGYYKLNDYTYSHEIDSTPNNGLDRYPAYLVMQDFETLDGNWRVTLRPTSSLTVATAYEIEFSTINTKPDPISGLTAVETSKMISHIISEDIGWSPWSRLYFQAGFNYVISSTRTPASEVTQAILKAQNNYWTLNFSSNFVLDNKTDLKVAYFYYRADDFSDNSAITVNYGAGAEEHAVTLTVVRRIRADLRLTARYGFFANRDELYGGHLDYDAHLVYCGLQYRF